MAKGRSTGKKSAGLLLYRFKEGYIEFMLVHPGGPFWKNKNEGAWSIPKGEFDNEDPLAAALREFQEETGHTIDGKFLELTPVRQKNGKMVYAFAIEYDLDVSTIKSNQFEMEWPPRSGKKQQFPEIDKALWCGADEARSLLITAQVAFIEEVIGKL